jgi:hydroxymethylbilane synthase
MKPLQIGTRSSPLAMWQAECVAGLLADLGVETRIEKIRTSGDKQRTGPLASHGGKGLFVKELEEALRREEVDLAVHSLKDVPTVLSEEFALVAFLERADPRDCLVAGEGISALGDLPDGAVVGSCSPRRVSQALHAAPWITVQDLRGNVETRLRKAREGEIDATFLAKAGLDRLGIEEPSLIHPLNTDVMLPAAGQGIVAIETLAG